MDWIKNLQTAIDEQLIVGIPVLSIDLDMCREARNLFKEYNAKYYGGELPDVDVVLNPLISTEMVGCFKRNGLGIFGYDNKRPAIVICPRLIDSMRDLRTVMLHEMAHEYCWLHGITSVTGDGTHTIAFANVCVEHGLAYAKGEINCSMTILNEEEN